MAIELIEQKETPVLCIRTFTTIEALSSLIGESYGKILARMAELGEQPGEAPYTAYYNLDMQHLDVEMGFPVSRLFAEKDGVSSRALPAGKVATTLYKGPYAGMESAYNALFAWLGEYHMQTDGPFFEYYLSNPGEVPDEELLTKIVLPVREIGA